MIAPETKDPTSPSVDSATNNFLELIKHHKALFGMILFVVLFALIPLYGILVPPLPDLTQHIIVNKLLWEKLGGFSNLDIEIAWYLGYRLSAYIMVLIISFLKLFGISLVYLPKIVAIVFMSLHAIVIVPILYFALRSRDWKSTAMAACFVIPAVVCMYSACWFIGFLGYTLGVTLLIPTVFLTERFLRSGKAIDALYVFVLVVLIYMAHPFTLVFWLLWCFGRFVASVALWRIFLEWKRILILGATAIPIFLYHFAIAAGELSGQTQRLGTVSPFVTGEYWYQHRFQELYQGNYLRADEMSSAAPFAILALALIAISSGFAFLSAQNRRLRTTVLASVLFLFSSSWINEGFFPIPGGHWLAYNYRFSSTVYALCIAMAAVTLIRSLPVATSRLPYWIFFVVLGSLSLIISASHVSEVTKAYARFDIPARAIMVKVIARERPIGIALPRSRYWFPDARFLRHYSCLQEPDCNPAGTSFRNIGSDIYPIRLKSTRRIFPQKPYPPSRTGKPGNAMTGGEGYAGGQFSQPRGITTDSHDNLFVADTGNSRIQQFDPDGNFINDFGTYGTGVGEFTSPHGVAIDISGSIYVVDPAGQKLLRFASDGTFDKEWRGSNTSLTQPMDVSIGADNRVYIADGNQIVVFNPENEQFSTWGTVGSEKGQFYKLTGIGVGGDFVFVADSGNNRIQMLDLKGKFVRMWDVEAWAKYVWHYPDVAFDERNKHVYVSSGWSREVLVFDSKGNLLDKMKPNEKTELNNPSSIALSKASDKNRLFVLSTGSDIVDNGDPGVALFEPVDRTEPTAPQ